MRAFSTQLVRFCRWFWKIVAFLAVTVFLGIVVNVMSTWLTSSKGTIPPDSPFGDLMKGWPITVLVGCSLLLFAALVYTISRWNIATSEIPLPSAQDRERILQRLYARYEQMYAQSLQGTVQVELGFEDVSVVTYNEAALALHLPEHPIQKLPAYTSIVEVYEQRAQKELLILGKPGSGKSTLLLELASHLIKQAEQDLKQPLPILLPLSPWANKRLPLQEWLVKQFEQLYNVPHKLSQQWVQSEQVYPLLDGLDEMDESARPACIAAINAYHHEHLGPLVICSRTDEYQRAVTPGEQLNLHTAIEIQPLTSEQITAYLEARGKPFTGLRTALRKNTTLQEIATTPLMLHILMLTYYGISVRALSQKGPHLQKQIWTDYVQHMIKPQKDDKRYSPLFTTTKLGWLAHQMQAHNQTIFFLEQLQADWLPSSQRIFYQWSTRLILLLYVWLISALAIGFSFGLYYGQTEGPGNGLVNGLFLGFFDGLLVTLLFSGIVIGPYLSKHYKLNTAIEPTVAIFWSWKEFKVRVRSAYLLLALVLLVVLGLVAWLATGMVIWLIVLWLFVMLSIGFSGLTGKQQIDHLTLVPNEGIRRSFKHGLLVGLSLGLLSGLLFGLLFGLPYGVPFGLSIGLLLGLLSGLDNGLNAALQHFILRIFLAYNGSFLWKAIPFLEYATTCIFLRRVGGGYSFTHRLLLDYFADSDLLPSSDSTDAESTKSVQP